jgi:hypothetical protein
LAAYLISDEIGCPAVSDRAVDVIRQAREIFARIQGRGQP